MNKYYILENKEIKEIDLMTWAKWFENADRQIGIKTVNGVKVSTVFLGIDHSFGLSKPVIFETMIFGGNFDGEQERYCTYEEAETGHKRWLNKINGATQ